MYKNFYPLNSVAYQKARGDMTKAQFWGNLFVPRATGYDIECSGLISAPLAILMRLVGENSVTCGQINFIAQELHIKRGCLYSVTNLGTHLSQAKTESPDLWAKIGVNPRQGVNYERGGCIPAPTAILLHLHLNSPELREAIAANLKVILKEDVAYQAKWATSLKRARICPRPGFSTRSFNRLIRDPKFSSSFIAAGESALLRTRCC